MLLTLQNARFMAGELGKVLFKNKVRMDFILYTHPERDPIPTAMLSDELNGVLIAAASPVLLGPRPRWLENSVLFSVVADETFWAVWATMRDTYGYVPTSATFLKEVDDPQFWLMIKPTREEVECQWEIR